MTTNRKRLEVSGIAVDVVRKDIKNLHLAVYPPHGRVRVAVPLYVTDETIRLAVISRLAWIRRQQDSLGEQQRQSKREMVTGESHFVQGRRYRLDVIEHDAAPTVIQNGKTLELRVRPRADDQKRLQVLHGWYRQLIRYQLPELLGKWQPIIGVEAKDCRIKKMKTKWSACNIEDQLIWLNLELAKKPLVCLEYILVHELAHLLERHHNDRFRDFMDFFLPNWRTHRDELNRAPLAHEDWEY